MLQPDLATLYSSPHKLLWCFRYRGWGMTALTCLGNLFRFARTEWYWKFKERQFDRRYGIDTRGLIYIESMDVSRENQQRGWGYMATQPEWYGILLSQLSIDYSQFTLVDFGSGKGRSLLLAAQFPFRRIIGVEFSLELHEIAERNLNAGKSNDRQCHDLLSVHEDATEFDLPTGPLVLYFYNPFKETVMRRVVENIGRSIREDPRPVILVYVNPTCRHVLDDSEFLSPMCNNLDHDPAVMIYECREE